MKILSYFLRNLDDFQRNSSDRDHLGTGALMPAQKIRKLSIENLHLDELNESVSSNKLPIHHRRTVSSCNRQWNVQISRKTIT